MKKNIDILCTRSLGEPALQKARAAGFAINCLTFIETVPIDNEDLAEKMDQLLREEVVVVFTSQKAVQALIPYMEKAVNWKIFCTGGTTKEQVIELFGEDAIINTARNAKELTRKILEYPELQKVVFFTGNKSLTTIPNELKKKHIQLEQVLVYETILTPQFISKDYPGILFFSPSAVHSFFSENTIQTNVVLFSIGSTTTEIIQTYSSNKIITSEWPGQESLIDLLIAYDWNIS